MNSFTVHTVNAIVLFFKKHNFYDLNNVFLWLFLNQEDKEQYNLIPLVFNKCKWDWKVTINLKCIQISS